MKNLTESRALAFRTAESVAVNTNGKPKITNVNSYYFWTWACQEPGSCWGVRSVWRGFWNSGAGLAPHWGASSSCRPAQLLGKFLGIFFLNWSCRFGSCFTLRTFDSGVWFPFRQLKVVVDPFSSLLKSFHLFAVPRNSHLQVTWKKNRTKHLNRLNFLPFLQPGWPELMGGFSVKSRFYRGRGLQM